MKHGWNDFSWSGEGAGESRIAWFAQIMGWCELSSF
jgi:hypothetical protein